MAMSQSDADRFRSFAERYVIERASRFDPAEPRKDAWQAVQDAVSIYRNIAQVAYDKFEFAPLGQQAGVSQAAPNHASPGGIYKRPSPPNLPAPTSLIQQLRHGPHHKGAYPWLDEENGTTSPKNPSTSPFPR